MHWKPILKRKLNWGGVVFSVRKHIYFFFLHLLEMNKH